MKTLVITTVALALGLLSSPTFARGSVVDPDPAGIGTYLVSAVLLALGIAIFLYIPDRRGACKLRTRARRTRGCR